jgi:hypothetical protein
MFDWSELNLPEFEDVEDTKKRLNALHAQALKDKGIPTTIDKGSPGFNPGLLQAREVSVMRALGLEAKEIALVLNISPKVLKAYYTKELNVSHKIANLMVARKALELALSGRHPEMTKFWLKSQAKWKETSVTELTGKDGGPVEIGSARDKLARAMGMDSAPEQGNPQDSDDE